MNPEATIPELGGQAMELAAQNGQLILLNEVLRWAGKHNCCLSETARQELIWIAERYGA
jgi:hypothetical protein